MHIFKILSSASLLLLIASGCKTSREAASNGKPVPSKNIVSVERPVYRSAFTKTNDLVHTSLNVKFDWAKKYLYGTAVITLHPHFYPGNSVVLNARGMKINEVSLMNDGNKSPLNYKYSNDSLIITLDRVYKKEENYTVFIDYVARPDELDSIGGSSAISSDKGLYFINADGKDIYKPKQLWTQGETQANSVWFPTIDAPNQKMTQDITMTVDSSFTTLSNGLLVKSISNNDGTRSDTWKQTMPHSPYLVMMAVSEFAVVKDTWKGMEVSYYVDPAYRNVARKIFGNTPEMIEFFSNRFKVPYAWEKYSQVIAHDYVSGAMENTTATLHGEFIQQDERELLDYTGEDVISHELFHHWFGDLVTCESWSNIPLNEGFATYGEYLWNEYKYGKEEADFGQQTDLAAYLREAKVKQVDLIRFTYGNQDEMFDRHSYQKGGCTLHMLRKYVGDDAFFQALHLYLERNKFKNVEVHDLRLAFEEVTGEDLNWFFNQWYLNHGHPDLNISYDWNETAKNATVHIKQMQNLDKTSLFKIPLDVDVYVNGKVQRSRIMVEKEDQSFEFSCDVKPSIINVDAEKMLVGTKQDMHTNEEWIFLFKNSRHYTDRKEALLAFVTNYKDGSPESEIIFDALSDPFWHIRQMAIAHIETLAISLSTKDKVKEKLKVMIGNDAKSSVRNAALISLLKYFPGDDHTALLKAAMKDSSYTVAGEALSAFAMKNSTEALAFAKSMEDISRKPVREMLMGLYADYGNDSNADFMEASMKRAVGHDRYGIVQLYSKWLMRCNNVTVLKSGIQNIYDQARNDESWLTRAAAIQSLKELKNYFKDTLGNLAYPDLIITIDRDMEELQAEEKDVRLKKVIGNH